MSCDTAVQQNHNQTEMLQAIIDLSMAQIDSIAMNIAPPIDPANAFVEIRNTAAQLQRNE